VAESAENIMSLIKVADERMYANKRLLRRNRPPSHARVNGRR
jgi:hypothetical protein